ncbi:N-acetylneuraminate synthase family protein [Methylobrevis pamukkalensis]|uniref:N,N'-diacetyllegionaminic acid synthase n=1 Tax=Methylobrevis pamukkalensis TaxID=1439726 RepID=A0A1E3H7Z9_9HYPH|nr:N-acetylneuraminate synthase family protein [Methylobrevis pamukkalensis]ODN71916.1 N,N'-diacetyllegionaminic acid synthase [Methylobrevis pamukkalensis]
MTRLSIPEVTAPPKVVAEIGCNHKGDMAIAEEMIMMAATFCKVDAVKFQKRNNRELLSPEAFDAPHPNPMHAYGPTYGAHREFLEFSTDQHRRLKEICDRFGVEYSTSVWDVTSAREMISLKPKFLKVPSALNLNFEMLSVLTDEYAGEIHCSFGMTTREEEERIVAFFERKGRAKDVVLYACTSGYPVECEEVCLYEIVRLQEAYGTRVKSIGFSGHHHASPWTSPPPPSARPGSNATSPSTAPGRAPTTPPRWNRTACAA